MGTLRILLAMVIVLAHIPGIFGLHLLGGLVVQIFYVMSGFYMSFILSKKKVYRNPFKFWSNRFLRLYPSYLFILIFTVVVSLAYVWAGTAKNYPQISLNNYIKYFDNLSLIQIIVILTSQITMLFQDLFLFLGIDLTEGSFFWVQNLHDPAVQLWEFLLIPQAWTISIEVAFYALCPWLIKLNTQWLYLLVLSSFAVRGILGYHDLIYDPFSYRCFPLEISTFLLGFIIYKQLYQNLHNKKSKLIYNTKRFLLFNCLSILGISYFIGITNSINLTVVVFFALAMPFLFEKTKNSQFDRKLGNLSYPIYINHWIVIPISISIVRVLNISQNLLFIIVLAISITLALVMVKYIEQPIEKFRRKISTT